MKKKRTDSGACGVLNIDKPAGMTSHDVVNEMRRLLETRRVGHAGTLDPAATGVLLVCVGHATRLAEYLVAGTKEYEGTILFGVTTNTWDGDGEVVGTNDASGLQRDAVEAALQEFVGDIEQQPPAYSAIKRDGVPAYKRARRGETVELEPRRVRVDEVVLLDFEAPRAKVRVRCQAGTYMRSIAHEVGEALGVGAHLESLVRSASGSWRVEDAFTIGDVALAVAEERVDSVLLPLESALRDLPGVTLDDEQVGAIAHGQEVWLECDHRASTLCAYDARHELVAILRPSHGKRWRPRKVFRRQEPA